VRFLLELSWQKAIASSEWVSIPPKAHPAEGAERVILCGSSKYSPHVV
jgi:hypothetical protein